MVYANSGRRTKLCICNRMRGPLAWIGGSVSLCGQVSCNSFAVTMQSLCLGRFQRGVNGLMLQLGGEDMSRESLLQWDYGLSLDQEIPCLNRGRGPLPFDTMYDVWDMLGHRRKVFEAEEEDESMAVQQVHWAER